MKHDRHYRLTRDSLESMAYLRGKWRLESDTKTIEEALRIAELNVRAGNNAWIQPFAMDTPSKLVKEGEKQ